MLCRLGEPWDTPSTSKKEKHGPGGPALGSFCKPAAAKRPSAVPRSTTFGRSVNHRRANPSVAVIHVVGLVTNGGQRDGKVVGGAAATIPCGWGDETEYNQAYELGKGVQYDADAFGVSLAGRVVLSYLNAGLFPHYSLIILSHSRSGISDISDTHTRSRSTLLTSLMY